MGQQLFSRTISCVVAIIMVCTASRTDAVEFYAVDWSGTFGSPPTSKLYRIDTSTQTITIIGDTGWTKLNSMGIGSSGQLYSWSSASGSGIVINPHTGVGSELFRVRINPIAVQAMAVDWQGWWVIANTTSYNGSVSQLYQVNPSSGGARLVADTGASAIQALAVHPVDGNLYAWDLSRGLGIMNPYSGLFRYVGGGNSNIQSICFDAAGTHLYGVGGANVYQINPSTGSVLSIWSSLGYDFRGAEFVPEPVMLTLATPMTLLMLQRGRRRGRMRRQNAVEVL